MSGPPFTPNPLPSSPSSWGSISDASLDLVCSPANLRLPHQPSWLLCGLQRELFGGPALAGPVQEPSVQCPLLEPGSQALGDLALGDLTPITLTTAPGLPPHSPASAKPGGVFQPPCICPGWVPFWPACPTLAKLISSPTTHNLSTFSELLKGKNTIASQ